MKNYHHGDLSLHKMKELPKGLKKINHKDTFVLAEGETSGHVHLLRGDFQVFQDEKGNYVLDMKKGTLEHSIRGTKQKAEHNTHTIIKGYYIVQHERGYNPFSEEIENVID